MLNVLIIGCGGQGCLADAPGSGNEHKVISFTKAFAQRDKFKIFLYDKDFKKAVHAVNIWNKPNLSAIFDYTGIMHLIDIVVITTPDDTHFDILQDVVKHKPGLVICEKPLCNDIAQSEHIVELYKKCHIPLMVNYTRRFIPELQKIKRDYDAGLYGKFLYGNCTFNRGLIHSGSHATDFFNWILGTPRNGIPVDSRIRSNEICNADYRVWNLEMFFEKFYFVEQRIGDELVLAYFDLHMQYVVDNACNFFIGKEPLLCTGEDALRALQLIKGLN